MIKGIRRGLLAVWVVVASLLLTRFFVTHVEYLPEVPSGAAEWLVSVTGVGCCEEVAELEAGLVLAVCLTVVTLLTWAATTIGRRILG